MTARKPVDPDRRCQFCGEEIPAEKRKGTKYCDRACRQKVQDANYRNRHSERRRQQWREWNVRNFDYRKEYRSAYALENRERINENARRIYRETDGRAQKKYDQNHRELRRQQSRLYRENLAIEAIDLLNDIKEKTS